LYGNNINQN